MERRVTETAAEGNEEEHAELVAAAVAGDPAALSELLARYGPGVESSLSIHRRWRGVLDATDVMQVTYLEAFLAIRSFRHQGARRFAAWLRRLAEHNLQDAIRALGRRKRAPALPARQHGGSDPNASRDILLEAILATSSTPSRTLRRDEATSRLDAAIGRLPSDYAAVIRGHDLQGRSIESVARELGRSPGAVHMLRARALERLADQLRSADSGVSIDRR